MNPPSQRARRLLKSPAIYILGLSVLALAVYHVWVTTLPLSAADWPWIPRNQLRSWFPWPPIWWPEVGFGLKNFAGVYEWPIEAIGGLLSFVSPSWAVAEKVLYFLPFAVLSFVAPWILAREILASRNWALLSALIFATNTYFLTFSVGGQMYLAVAEVLAPIVFFAVIRSMRKLSVRWALGAGLLLGLQAAYEVRITYLTVLVCIAYGGIVLLRERGRPCLAQRVGLLAASLAVLAGTQLYWLIPLLTYRGDLALPTASSPWLAFMRLLHGLAGVAPGWTGGTPATFQYVPVNPVFFIFPIVAFLALMARRLSSEILALSLSALAAAFFIKQTNPPLGSVYQWMFLHVPGWNLFREGSKFYFIVALAYAILIPFAVREAFGTAIEARAMKLVLRLGAITAMFSVIALAVANLVPLETGAIGFTTYPIPEPTAVKTLSSLLAADPTYGAVLWVGGAWFGERSESDPNFVKDHNFVARSVRHPTVELLGAGNLTDPLSAFCRYPDIPFCYLHDKQLLTYLINRTGANYVVAPASARVGRFEVATNSETVLARLRSALGEPQIIGDETGRLAVWKLGDNVSPIVAAPAVSMVDGPPESTEDVLPALQAVGMPAVYGDSALGSLPRSSAASAIEIVPGQEGTYNPASTASYVVLAPTNAPTMEVQEGVVHSSLPRALLATRVPGWAVYGPIVLARGPHRFTSSQGTTLGPLIAWSPMASQALSGTLSEQSLAAGRLEAEYVAASTATSATWIELRRTFDPGWTSDSATVHLAGDSLFNLYSFNSGQFTPAFAFSTRGAEGSGTILALMWVAGIIGTLIFLRRSDRNRGLVVRSAAIPGSTVKESSVFVTASQYSAVIGATVLVFAALSQAVGWFDLPHNGPLSLFADRDPYALAELLVTAAFVFLLLATLLRLVAARTGKPWIGRSAKIYNYLSMHAALVVDRVMTRAPTYAPADWSTVLTHLDRIYPGSAKFLLEPQVSQLESYIREKAAATREGGPWALALNTDLALARCVYVVCRAVRPAVVIETGVAYGVSSTFILQALATNENGVLHSIDLPLPGTAAKVTGALIPERLRDRWHLHLGPSQTALPALIDSLATVDVFVHDSLHTYINMRREFQVVWPHLAPGGVLISDDVEGNEAFKELRLDRPRYWQVVRQDQKPSSLFGIAIKPGPIEPD